MGAGRPRRHRPRDAIPILGVDSDNGSEFINHHLLAWCQKRQITFTPRPRQQERRLPRRAESGPCVRGRLPPLRHRTELLLLDKDVSGTAVAADLLYPTAKSWSRRSATARKCPREIRPCDHPHRRGKVHSTISAEDKAILTDAHTSVDPAVQRRIQALTAELLNLTTTKAAPKTKAPIAAPSYARILR